MEDLNLYKKKNRHEASIKVGEFFIQSVLNKKMSLHTEIIHRPENKVLYVTHHRFVPRAQAIQQTYNPEDIPTVTDLTKLFVELRTRFQR